MTPRIRRLAIVTVVLLLGLGAFAVVRARMVMARARPLADAYREFLSVDMEAYASLEQTIRANGDDCAKAADLAIARLKALETRHAEAVARVQRLRSEAGSREVEAADGLLAQTDVPAQMEQLKKSQPDLLPVLARFRKQCPAQAQAVDAEFLRYHQGTAR